MKKISLTILFYCVLGLVFYSCGCSYSYILTGSSDLQITGAIAEDSTGLVTAIGQFHLEDYHEFSLVSNNSFEGLGIQQAYAYSPCYTSVNPILIEELELYFDQDVTLDNTTVPASKNILASRTFSQYFNIYQYHGGRDLTSSLRIELDSTLFSPSIFTDGPMNIRLVTKEEDGTSFESELDIIVDM